MTVNDVVQFNEKHKWCGCLGIISEDKGIEHPRRYMIGVPIPDSGIAYIFDDGSSIEYIGKAVLVEGETIAIKAITKTGRHFPEVGQMLEKMRGEM